jgi:serine/threonine-protein kinase
VTLVRSSSFAVLPPNLTTFSACVLYIPSPRRGGLTTVNLTASRQTATPSLGEILFGYEVLEPIGRGAGSTLYAVTEPGTGQLYALKHVRVEAEKDARYVEQLRNELAVSGHLRHPGLRRAVRFHDRRVGITRKVTEAALVLELFDGTPIDQVPATGPADLLAHFARAAEALSALHRGGWVHCDLKPSNILLGSDGTVRVIDFGQACRAGTVKERIQGTPEYIAPEQVRREPVTPRTDVFNFGASLYRVLTGQSIPTLYTTRRGANSFLVEGRIPSPRELAPGVPEPLSNLVMECVRTDPARRPADMKDIALRLEIARHSLLRSTSLRVSAAASDLVAGDGESPAARPAGQYRLTGLDLWEFAAMGG